MQSLIDFIQTNFPNEEREQLLLLQKAFTSLMTKCAISYPDATGTTVCAHFIEWVDVRMKELNEQFPTDEEPEIKYETSVE